MTDATPCFGSPFQREMLADLAACALPDEVRALAQQDLLRHTEWYSLMLALVHRLRSGSIDSVTLRATAELLLLGIDMAKDEL